MLALSIRFLSGRFHATPWGRHVNEAAPEWPPSPWRILRSFVASWKRKLDDPNVHESRVIESMLRNLALAPNFVLPPASMGHSRHFMPLYKPGDKTMVFDSFVCLDMRKPVLCLWPDIILTPEEHEALTAITANLGFLGRAESWADARVLTEDEAAAAQASINCMPSSASSDRVAFETVRVLCADPNTAFGNEHTPKHKRTKGRGKNKQTIITPLYDPDWHLCMETLELHDKCWSDPPGSKWVTYLRRKDCFSVASQHRRMTPERSRPTMARFALDGTVLPLVEETLIIAEIARRTAMGIYRRIEEKRLYGGNRPDEAPLPRSDVFSGKDENGEPLEGHRHAYYLPTDEDGDGRIDHLTIVAAMGFGTAEVRALDEMHRLKRDDGDPLNLVLLALGQSSEILAPKIMGPARVWFSATPFIATRFPKARGQKKDPPELLGIDNQRAFAQQVLIKEIERLRLNCPEISAPLSVEPLNTEHRCGAHGLRPIQFKRYRRKRGDDGGRRPAGAFQIVFPEPVYGPICLGHSAHFGLGLFVTED